MSTILKQQKKHQVETKSQKIYSYEQVLKSSISYFKGDELAATTWMNKYAVKNNTGEFVELSPDDMHKRMAKEFGRIEADYKLKYNLNGSAKFLSQYGQEREDLTEEKVYKYFKDFGHIIPQGSVMSSLGNSYQLASLSNCIVVPELHDSYGGVFYTDQQLAQLFKRRCGVGVDISNLRPTGASVSNAAKSTSGAVSFMNRFSNTTREVAQNGRRGALMLSMDIAHPDVKEFITIASSIKILYEARDFNKAMREIMSLADKANQYVDKMQPWVLSKTDPKDEVIQQICTTSLNLFRILAIMLKPVTPELANKIAAFFNDHAYTWNSIDEPLLEQNINQFKPLLGRIDDQSIEQLIKPEK